MRDKVEKICCYLNYFCMREYDPFLIKYMHVEVIVIVEMNSLNTDFKQMPCTYICCLDTANSK